MYDGGKAKVRPDTLQEPVWFKAGAQIFTGEGIRYLGAFTIPAFSDNIILTLATEVSKSTPLRYTSLLHAPHQNARVAVA